MNDYYDDYELEKYNEMCNNIEEFCMEKQKKDILLNELLIGQTIIIHFYPYSQKYIYKLYPKYGKIIKLGTLNSLEDFLIEYLDEENNYKTTRLFHESVSYIGNDMGYDYVINLVE